MTEVVVLRNNPYLEIRRLMNWSYAVRILFWPMKYPVGIAQVTQEFLIIGNHAIWAKCWWNIAVCPGPKDNILVVSLVIEKLHLYHTYTASCRWLKMNYFSKVVGLTQLDSTEELLKVLALERNSLWSDQSTDALTGVWPQADSFTSLKICFLF